MAHILCECKGRELPQLTLTIFVVQKHCKFHCKAHSKYFSSFLIFKTSSNILFDFFFFSEALVIFVFLEIPPFLRWPFSGNRLYAEGHTVIIFLIRRNTKGFEILTEQNITGKNYQHPTLLTVDIYMFWSGVCHIAI